MPKRVICVMGRVLDQDDGLGVYSANLLEHMFAMDRASLYLLLLRTDKHRNRFRHFDHVESRVIPTKRKILWDQVTVPRVARQRNADIVFNPKFSLPLLSGRPGVFVLHGSDWYVNPQNYEWWDNLYIRLLLPLYCRRAKHMMAISRTIVDDLVKFAGVDRDKVTVSYAAPSSQFQPSPDPERLERFAEEHRLPKRFIFSVARAYHSGHGKLPPYPGGNVETLVRAYEAYRTEGGELPLVIAGERIDDYLRSTGFGEEDLRGIRFLGFVPHDEINLAYALAEFFVLTTLYESFGFPLVEAMAVGCPAIVPNTGACPEIAGGAATLIDPHDVGGLARALQEMARSDEKRARQRELGLKRSRDFSWSATAEKTLNVFDRIMRAEGP